MTGPFDALGRLTAEKWDAGFITKGNAFLPGSNLAGSYSTSLTNAGVNTNVYSVSSMTWQGPLLASYNVSSNWEGSGTAYAAAYDADAHLLQWNATPVSSAGAATQQFNEGYTFKLENLKTVNVTNSIGASIVSNYNYADAVSAERVTSVTSPSALVSDSYAYDKRGRGLVVQHKLSATQSPAQDSYEYDSLNRLTSIAHLGAVQETLGYDGAGDLASRQFPSGSPDIARYYVGDDLTLVNHNASTTTGFVHIRIGGKRLASFWSKTASGVSTNGVIYYHRDRRGDVVATTANGGVMGLSYRYLPSGAVDKIVNASGAVIAPSSEPDNVASELGFIGGLRLSGGLIHLKARAYLPTLRRFLQPDTMDLRRYTYAAGDPLNLTDPTGRNPNPDPARTIDKNPTPPPPPPSTTPTAQVSDNQSCQAGSCTEDIEWQGQGSHDAGAGPSAPGQVGQGGPGYRSRLINGPAQPLAAVGIANPSSWRFIARMLFEGVRNRSIQSGWSDKAWDTDRLLREFPDQPNAWEKMGTENVNGTEVHWLENTQTGFQTDLKVQITTETGVVQMNEAGQVITRNSTGAIMSFVLEAAGSLTTFILVPMSILERPKA